jgi:hypothetical protein
LRSFAVFARNLPLAASIAEIERWADRMLGAATLADVLAEG